MKMIMRRGAAVFLAVLFIAITIFGTTAAAADAADRGVKMYRGTFHYTGNKDTFYYADSYFENSGCVENEHLRTMSAAMAFSLLGTSPQDTVDLMTDIGMETDSIVMEDMDERGTADTIGTVIAKKELADMPLVAVVICGSDYAGEWANNMQVGSEGDASGFAASAAKVSARIQAYLTANNITKAKIWVCGYSRAGGVANLVGRAMNEDYAAYCTTKDDIYVYTFEAPRCSADDTVYQNIYNIFDVNDVVPHLCPEAWGLHLNGVEVKIGNPDDTLLTQYFNPNVDGYVVDYQERAKSLFLEQFDSFLGTTISREQYASAYEEPISSALEICLYKNSSERETLLEYAKAIGEELKNSSDDLEDIISRAYWGSAGNADVNTLSTLIKDTMDALRPTEDFPLTDEEYDTLKASVTPLVTMAIILANQDGCYQEKNEQGRNKYYSFYHILTFAMNIDELIVQTHLNKYVFEKLKDLDPFYTAGVRIKPGDVYIGQNRYTFDDNGWPLEDIVKQAGFTEEDQVIWRNGYELKLENVMTKIDEPSMQLYLAAAGKFDKSMNMYEFYQLTMTKTVGFRSYPVDPAVTPVKLKDNPICLTIPQETAKKCVRYGVVRVDSFATNDQYRLDTEIVKTENGDVELWVNAIYPAVYASAIDDRRYCTSADVDWDDTVSVMDATHIQRYLANLETFDSLQKKVADVDGDGSTTTVDVTWIQRSLAKQDIPYKVGEQIAI